MGLQAEGRYFSEYPALPARGGHGNGWLFSVIFTQAGSCDIDLSGGWETEVNTGYSNESASRHCHYTDPDFRSDLSCDAWSWYFSDADDWYTLSGSLSAGPLRVEVSGGA